jgi:two-component system chemotaxis response regulator CheY
MYKNFFEMAGYEIVGNAYDGSEALDHYKQLDPKPDVVIMDHFMPYQNGLDAAKDILDYDPEAKIIFVTVDDRIKKSALKIGAREFISKPFQIEDLLEKVREVADE